MYLGAIVTLPKDWALHPNAHYPVLVHHGHFPASAESDGWRETPPDPKATAAQRQTQAGGLPVLQGLERPQLPADDSRADPASDAVLRRFLRRELGEPRAVRRRHHQRSDSDDRAAVPRHRSGMGARHDRRFDRRLGSLRRPGVLSRTTTTARGRFVPIRSTSARIGR